MAAILGLDIGGANLKAAHSDGSARLQPFELWKQPQRLAEHLLDIAQSLPAFDLLAVTMTGESCDCYATRREGVNAILDAVETAAAAKPIRVWGTQGRFWDVADARKKPLQIAAANWLALAAFVGRLVPNGTALLVDIGSTTTDIVPLVNGKPAPRGFTDFERMKNQELVYTGVRRTPLCALLRSSGAAELFATTLDVFLTVGAIPEDPNDCATADRRPATRQAAHARLARMLGADGETCSQEETRKLAELALLRQTLSLTNSVEKVAESLPSSPKAVVLAGSGEFLARLVLHEQKAFLSPNLISLAERLGPWISDTACAYAVAILASEMQI